VAGPLYDPAMNIHPFRADIHPEKNEGNFYNNIQQKKRFINAFLMRIRTQFLWPSPRQKMSIGRTILMYGEHETESFNEGIEQSLASGRK